MKFSTWANGLTEDASPDSAADYVVTYDASATASKKVLLSNLAGGTGDANYPVCNGRLTLASGTPVPTVDTTTGSMLYLSPYQGDLIGLYDGASDWTVLSFTEKSLDISAFVTGTSYDIWAYNNSGDVALDSTAWTNGTTRATALTTVNGIYCKTGDTTRRYLGTIRIGSVTGRGEDSILRRYIWNFYNREPRKLYKSDGTGHNYTTAANRIFNNDATNRVALVLGLGQYVTASLHGRCKFSADGTGAYLGISLETIAAGTDIGIANFNAYYIFSGASGQLTLAAGVHDLLIYEYGGTTAAFAEVYLHASVMG